MNTTQTILLSTGILLTTATTATLSYTFLANNNGPLPVEAQRDTGEVQLVRTPVEPQTHTIKTTDGYTISYTLDNIHMNNVRTFGGDTKANLRYNTYGFRVENQTAVEITLNGTITDLAGNVEHFSDTEVCKYNEFEATHEELGTVTIESSYTRESHVVCSAGRKVFQF